MYYIIVLIIGLIALLFCILGILNIANPIIALSLTALHILLFVIGKICKKCINT